MDGRTGSTTHTRIHSNRWASHDQTTLSGHDRCKANTMAVVLTSIIDTIITVIAIAVANMTNEAKRSGEKDSKFLPSLSLFCSWDSTG